MQTIVQETVSVAANDSVSNALSGTDLEFAPRGGKVVVWLSGASAGVEATLRTPNQQLANENAVGASNNNPPDKLRDVFTSPFFVSQGERLILQLNNTTAGNIDVYITAQLT